jgi:ComF family protein
LIRPAKYLHGFFSLLYPKYCVVCKSSLFGNEEIICTVCRHSLPVTRFHLSDQNPVEQLFRGRLLIQFATSLLYFDKGSKYRNLVHQLKYQGRRDVGIFLGRMLGSTLKESGMQQPDFIVPVPLHRKKQRRRGYNQSELIARGISEVLNVIVCTNALRRTVFTDTQTRRKRYERWTNVENVFRSSGSEFLKGKHILLVDDVITTGATLEAAANQILKIENTTVSVASLAFASV